MKYQTHKEVDKFIKSLSGWQKDLCQTLRWLIHAAIPKGYEDWKWGASFKTKEGKTLVGLWALKKHVAIIFYNGTQIKDRYKLFNSGLDNKNNVVTNFYSREELTEEKMHQIVEYIDRLKVIEPKKREFKAVPKPKLPKEIEALLRKNKLLVEFNKLSNGKQRDYLEYLTSAKTAKTRQRRIQRTIERVKTGKAYY